MQPHWLARPQSIRLLWRVFIAMLVLIVAADSVVTHVPHFGVDASFAFNAWYALLACAVLIVAAKCLGAFLTRPDDYYDGSDA